MSELWFDHLKFDVIKNFQLTLLRDLNIFNIYFPDRVI